jgi:hypothetical protein
LVRFEHPVLWDRVGLFLCKNKHRVRYFYLPCVLYIGNFQTYLTKNQISPFLLLTFIYLPFGSLSYHEFCRCNRRNFGSVKFS